MARRVDLIHPSGLRNAAYIGWSWTSFFFGGFPALFRADVVGFLAWFGAAVVVGFATVGFGLPLIWFIWAAVYNRWHLTRLLTSGYRVEGREFPSHQAPSPQAPSPVASIPPFSPLALERQPVGRTGSLLILGGVVVMGAAVLISDKRRSEPPPVSPVLPVGPAPQADALAPLSAALNGFLANCIAGYAPAGLVSVRFTLVVDRDGRLSEFRGGDPRSERIDEAGIAAARSLEARIRSCGAFPPDTRSSWLLVNWWDGRLNVLDVRRHTVAPVAVPSAPVTVSTVSQRATVTVRQDANVRAEPNGQATVLRQARAGTVLEVLGENGPWRRVGQQGEPWGFVHSSLLQ